jgi:hypothetical protein
MLSQNRMLRTLRECERQADGEMGVRNMYLRFTNDLGRSKQVRCDERHNVAHTRQIRNAYNILVLKPKGYHLGDQAIDKTFLLKWVFNKSI